MVTPKNVIKDLMENTMYIQANEGFSTEKMLNKHKPKISENLQYHY